MRYIKQNFYAGQKLKASHLDHIEDGIIECQTNLQVGPGASSTQQLADKAQDGFDFTNKNLNATALDSALTGIIPYGAIGDFSSAFGGKCAAMGKRSMARGTTTIAKGAYSAAEGDNSVALGGASHAEGTQTVTGPDAYGAHAEGSNTQALKTGDHAEGLKTKADGSGAHAEGEDTQAINYQAHAEGNNTVASGHSSHAEGINTIASGAHSHTEGNGSKASGMAAHAEGGNCEAAGAHSHVGGNSSKINTSANGAFVHGNYLITSKPYSANFGEYNEGNYLFEYGFGSEEDGRRCCFAVNNNGDLLLYNYKTNTLYSLWAVFNALGAWDKVNPFKDYNQTT